MTAWLIQNLLARNTYTPKMTTDYHSLSRAIGGAAAGLWMGTSSPGLARAECDGVCVLARTHVLHVYSVGAWRESPSSPRTRRMGLMRLWLVPLRYIQIWSSSPPLI